MLFSSPGVTMKVHYLVEITKPEHHHVKVTMKIENVKGKAFQVFLPSWSPGSYLMREYARHIRWFQASQSNGEVLYHTQASKGVWEITWDKAQVKTKQDSCEIVYEMYCKELTVRTSHVDASHAFLHGPSYLMGILDEKMASPTIEFRFPPAWSKLSTGLKDISKTPSIFLYQAKDYDELIDAPVEIGCHETDGFEFLGKPHHLAHYGEIYPHKNNIKNDIKRVVETVAKHFNNDLPYEQYLFLTHFVPKLYGGLEHLNSTALQFDGRKIANRKDYLNFLSLVAHEYFHLWNVKRIRPKELGPFDYLNEGYSTLLWLAEGLTSLMDDLFVYRSKLSSLEEYLEIVKGNLDAYYNTPGKNYHSLEQSSFNAWIKLYRPDENSKNSSISYYLKGGLVFTALHSMLVEQGKSIDVLLQALWLDYKGRPESGVTRDSLYQMIKEIAGEEVLQKFSTMIETTEDIDFDSVFKKMGCELRWVESSLPWLGAEFEFNGDRVFIKSLVLDSPAHKAGLNSGDEIIFLNGLRFEKSDAEKMASFVIIDQAYEFIVSRLNKLERIEFTPGKAPRQLKEIAVIDRKLAERAFSFSEMPGQ
jgi:predicted metalloprotease with PDZ domain